VLVVLEELVFEKKVVFDGAIFNDQFILKNITFKGQVDFRNINTEGYFGIINCTFNNFVDFNGSIFKRFIRINDTKFNSPMMFNEVHCHDVLHVNNVVFNYMASFIDSIFEGDYEAHDGNPCIKFENIIFNDDGDYSNCKFKCLVKFDKVIINYGVEFIDSLFDAERPTSDIRSSTYQFHNLSIKEKGMLNFSSTDPKNKIFNNQTSFSFKDEVKGMINFEYVNFAHIHQSSRIKLRALEKQNKANIGKGCFKYRFQTDIKEESVREGNQPFITEFLDAFTKYFSLHSTNSLGVEIVGRTSEIIQFFYFTDQEDITEVEFKNALKMLQKTDWIKENINNETGKYLDSPNYMQDKDNVEKKIEKRFYQSKLKNVVLTIGLKIDSGIGSIKDIENIADVYPEPHEENYRYVIEGMNHVTINYINKQINNSNTMKFKKNKFKGKQIIFNDKTTGGKFIYNEASMDKLEEGVKEFAKNEEEKELILEQLEIFLNERNEEEDRKNAYGTICSFFANNTTDINNSVIGGLLLEIGKLIG